MKTVGHTRHITVKELKTLLDIPKNEKIVSIYDNSYADEPVTNITIETKVK